MLDHVVSRRLAGTIGVILFVALSFVGLRYAFSPAPESIEFTAELGTAGVGLSRGNSVKVRGVEIGQVVTTNFQDGLATARVRLDPGTEVPKDGLELVVTAKTLLGEKQIELSFPDDSFGVPPFISTDDRIAQSRQPTELQDALDALTPFLDGIDEEALATVIDILGSQQGEGEIIAQNLDLTAQVSAFLARTAEDTTDRFETLTSVVDQLTPAAEEFDRLNANLPAAVALLSERQDDISTNLDLLSAFSITLADYIQVEDDRIRQFLVTTDAVGTVLDPNMENIASFIEGAAQYSETLGKPSDFLTDGTIWAGFRIFLDLSTLGLPLGSGEGQLNLSPLTEGLPGLPIDITDITGDGGLGGLLPGDGGGLLPGGLLGGDRTTGLRDQPTSAPTVPPARTQPDPEPQPEPDTAPEPETAPEPTTDAPQQGSLLGNQDGGRR